MSSAAQTQRTTNPSASCYVEVMPRIYEDAYYDWLFGQLSRMPYLCKGLLRTAICLMLAPDLSHSLDRVARQQYLDGWQRGYKDGLRVAKDAQGG